LTKGARGPEKKGLPRQGSGWNTQTCIVQRGLRGGGGDGVGDVSIAPSHLNRKKRTLRSTKLAPGEPNVGKGKTEKKNPMERAEKGEHSGKHHRNRKGRKRKRDTVKEMTGKGRPRAKKRPLFGGACNGVKKRWQRSSRQMVNETEMGTRKKKRGIQSKLTPRRKLVKKTRTSTHPVKHGPVQVGTGNKYGGHMKMIVRQLLVQQRATFPGWQRLTPFSNPWPRRSAKRFEEEGASLGRLPHKRWTRNPTTRTNALKENRTKKGVT